MAAQVRLVRQTHKGTILILEGATDARLFGHFVDSALCDIEVAFGKKNLVDALDLLEDEGFPGVVAIADADFDRLIEKHYNLENLCLTDKHDLDLTIFTSSALRRYINEHADSHLFETEFKSDLSAVRDRIVNASIPISYCRFASTYRNLGLYFKDLKLDDFVSEDNLSAKTDELISELIRRSSTHCTETQLKTHITSVAVTKHDAYQLVNGHDVAAVLGIALRKVLGTRRLVHTWASEIESGLRLAFDWEGIRDTQIYEFLLSWETKNKGYRIFRRGMN